MMQGLTRYIKDRDTTAVPPEGTKAMPEVVSGLIDFHKKGGTVLEAKDPFTYPLANQIVVKQGTVLAIFNGLWRTFEISQEIVLGVDDLDTGNAFQVGTDYYVYLVDDGARSADSFLCVSANSTFPQGQSADNSRKIGGFHYGHVRGVVPKGRGFVPCSPEGVILDTGDTWKRNVVTGIIPNSVWDLVNRPSCSPEGMALVGDVWVDLYPSSVAEAITFEKNTNGLFVASGLLQSKYGQLPATGTEGCHWYAFNELAVRSGKRLLSQAEWVRAAYGNPGGQDANDEFGWTKTNNTGRARIGCNVDPNTGLYVPAGGIKPYAISAYNMIDMVGNTHEWIDELTVRQDSTSWTWQNVLGADKGHAYLPNATGLSAFVCGGYWDYGVRAGPRAVSLGGCPWYVSVNFGARLACDKLAA